MGKERETRDEGSGESGSGNLGGKEQTIEGTSGGPAGGQGPSDDNGDDD